MPKLDFNVPLLDENQEPVKKPKLDLKKQKPAANGQLIPTAVVDDEGNMEFEIVYLREPLTKILNQFVEGDDKLTFEERAKIGKLARKVSDRNAGSLKNYSIDELAIIQAKVTKLGSTELVTQIDSIINGEESGDDSKSAKKKAA